MEDKRTPMEAEVQELLPEPGANCPENSYGTAAKPRPRRSWAPLWICVGLAVIALCTFSVIAALSPLRVENGEDGWKLAVGEAETRQPENPFQALELRGGEDSLPVRSQAPDALQLPLAAGSGEELTPAELYAAASPAVVRVRVERYYGESDYTGVIISADGYILSATEGLSNAVAISVSLPDGTACSARKLGEDRISGVCLLKVEAEQLPTVRFAAEAEPAVGQNVWCVCNPYGAAIPNVFRDGMLSVCRRVELGGTSYTALAVSRLENVGSGCPILDSSGRVLGLTSPIGQRLVSGEDPGFAVSAADLDRILRSFEGAAGEGQWLGFEAGDIPTEFLYLYHFPGKVWIDELSADSPLSEVLCRYDVITAVDGTELRSAGELAEIVSAHRPGDRLTLTLFRSGQWYQIVLPVTER